MTAIDPSLEDNTDDTAGSVSSLGRTGGSRVSRVSRVSVSGGDITGAKVKSTRNDCNAIRIVKGHYQRRVRKTPEIRMIPGVMNTEGRRLRYSVSDNEDAYGPQGPGSPPIWAVNIHGYFAGGGMYWRESTRIAQELGWRVVNPSLPGFGGSDPLEWKKISLAHLSDQVELIMKHVGAGPAVVLGHSMGGAVAIQYAHDHPSRTLGIIYRDGIATPAWKDRHGLIPTVMAPFAPNMAPFADMIIALMIDVPDLFAGRLYSTVRSVLPDVRRNIRTMGRTLPVGSMLMTVDLVEEIRSLVAKNIPILNEWGCFDRVSTDTTAREFSEASSTVVQWVPGGHSWMLARPQGQANILTTLASGKSFTRDVQDRWRKLVFGDHSIHALD